MIFDILTIFPRLLDSYIQDSIIKREIKKGTIKIRFHDIRKYSKDKHKKVDDTPYGGGAGMVMTPQPVYDAIFAVKKLMPRYRRTKPRSQNPRPVIYLSPKGKKFTYEIAKRLSKKRGLILLCGRYEGIDERALKLCTDEEISIGDYVLTGGELAAMVVIDAVMRLIPGALGDKRSAREDSFSEALGGKKEYPHYTKPRVFKNLRVPDVLLTGDHAKISAWRKKHLK